MRIRILAGQYYDSETGLHYNWHCYYDPKTGRYFTPDPIGLEGGINLYVYAGLNPTNAIDPLGLKIRLIGDNDSQSSLLKFLSDIAGTDLSMNSDGDISSSFCGNEEFSQIQAWIKEIIDSDYLVTIQFGATVFGGYFRNGKVYIDSVFKTPNQQKYIYRGKPILKYGFLMGESHAYKAQGMLAHELLGHGLDWVRGGPSNPYGVPRGLRTKLERTAKGRANEVRSLLGYPKRYR